MACHTQKRQLSSQENLNEKRRCSSDSDCEIIEPSFLKKTNTIAGSTRLQKRMEEQDSIEINDLLNENLGILKNDIEQEVSMLTKLHYATQLNACMLPQQEKNFLSLSEQSEVFSELLNELRLRIQNLLKKIRTTPNILANLAQPQQNQQIEYFQKEYDMINHSFSNTIKQYEKYFTQKIKETFCFSSISQKKMNEQNNEKEGNSTQENIGNVSSKIEIDQTQISNSKFSKLGEIEENLKGALKELEEAIYSLKIYERVNSFPFDNLNEKVKVQIEKCVVTLKDTPHLIDNLIQDQIMISELESTQNSKDCNFYSNLRARYINSSNIFNTQKQIEEFNQSESLKHKLRSFSYINSLKKEYPINQSYMFIPFERTYKYQCQINDRIEIEKKFNDIGTKMMQLHKSTNLDLKTIIAKLQAEENQL